MAKENVLKSISLSLTAGAQFRGTRVARPHFTPTFIFQPRPLKALNLSSSRAGFSIFNIGYAYGKHTELLRFSTWSFTRFIIDEITTIISWVTNYSLILARNFRVNVKLQNCYGNVSYISVARWRPGLKMLRIIKEVKALKDAAENLHTRKSTISCVRVFENWCDENVLEKNPETVCPERLDKVLERFFACVCKQDGADHT